MYVVPILILVLVIAAGTAWTPIFGLIIAVPLFLLFLAYVGFSRRADEKATGADGAPASGEGEGPHGIWGEKSS
jgi:Sec-independent protein secretion pathway component TatC